MLELFVNTLVKSIDMDKLLSSPQAKQLLGNVETIKATFLRIQEQNDLILKRLEAIKEPIEPSARTRLVAFEPERKPNGRDGN